MRYIAGTNKLAFSVWKHEIVRDALRSHLEERNSYHEHRLHSALVQAGVSSEKERERIIAFMEDSPRFREDLGLPPKDRVES